MKVSELATGRAGDKGPVLDLTLVTEDAQGYELLERELTEPVVERALELGPVRRYEVPGLNALKYVVARGAGRRRVRHRPAPVSTGRRRPSGSCSTSTCPPPENGAPNELEADDRPRGHHLRPDGRHPRQGGQREPARAARRDRRAGRGGRRGGRRDPARARAQPRRLEHDEQGDLRRAARAAVRGDRRDHPAHDRRQPAAPARGAHQHRDARARDVLAEHGAARTSTSAASACSSPTTARTSSASRREMRARDVKPEFEIYSAAMLEEVAHLLATGILEPPYVAQLRAPHAHAGRRARHAREPDGHAAAAGRPARRTRRDARHRHLDGRRPSCRSRRSPSRWASTCAPAWRTTCSSGAASCCATTPSWSSAPPGSRTSSIGGRPRRTRRARCMGTRGRTAGAVPEAAVR